MNEKQLYESQYGKGELAVSNSFPVLRKLLARYDLHREDLAARLLDGGKRLLDIGCGEGRLMAAAAGRYRRLNGIDIEKSRLAAGRRMAAKRVDLRGRMRFTCCNVNRGIPFPARAFNGVTAIAVIEHVFDPYYVIDEVWRVLARHGVFVSQVPNIAYLRHRLRLLCGYLPVTASALNWRHIGWDGGHLHYFSVSSYCGLLRECGFEVERVSGSGLLAGLRNWYPGLLTGDICVKARKRGRVR